MKRTFTVRECDISRWKPEEPTIYLIQEVRIVGQSKDKDDAHRIADALNATYGETK